MFYLALLWIGIIGAVLLLATGVLLLIVFLRRTVRARRAAPAPGEPAPAFEPNRAYRQYDPANPHYRDGYQWADGAWHHVQVHDPASGQWYLHGVDAGRNPQAQPVGTPAPAPRKPPRLVPSIVGVTVSALVIAGAVPLGVVTVGTLAESSPATGILPREIVSESQEYRFTAPLTIDSTQAFTYQFHVDQLYVDFDSDGYWGNTSEVAVYRDAELTQIAAYDHDIEPSLHQLTLMPQAPEIEGASLAASWAPNSQLYLVQFVDRDGNEYDKPIVTRADVRPDSVATPEISHRVAQGVLEMEWAAVEGATEYRVIFERSDRNGHSRYEVLDTLPGDATSWRSSDRDAVEGACPDVGMQNCALAEVASLMESDRLDAEIDGQEGWQLQSTSYGVIAVGDDGTFSAMHRVSAGAFEAQLPLRISEWTTPEARSADAIPTTLAVQTVAGTEAILPVTLVGGDPATRNVDLVVAGTSLRPAVRLGEEAGAWDTAIADVQSRLSSNLNRTGSLEESLHDAQLAWSGESAVTEMPDVPYPIDDAFGELGEYLAAHLIAGNATIDVTELANSPYEPYELIYAVIAQNPYILGVRGVRIVQPADGRWILVVDYHASADELAAEQQQMAQKAEEIVSSVISDGMSEGQKALALNDWIAQNAEYDHEAFGLMNSAGNTVADSPEHRNAWTAYGILLEGIAVCGGYAEAYKLLSDEAGLDSVYVRGNAGGPHAWNKTLIDGQWRVIDPTWNDTTPANELFALTDQQALEEWDHELGDGWMVGQLVSQYAAN